MEKHGDHRRASVKGLARASLSPPVWKDQLKQRCMERLKQDRRRLLAKLRSPDASTSIAAEMRRIVRKEGQRGVADDVGDNTEDGAAGHRRHAVFDLLRNDVEEEKSDRAGGAMEEEMIADDSSIDELLEKGKLSQQEYLELVHSLEEALLAEMELENAGPNDEQLAEHMMEFEEASLEAMLAGMDLDDTDVPSYEDDVFDDADVGVSSGESDFLRWTRGSLLTGHVNISNAEAYMLCPICKVNSLRDSSGSTPSISCACGFSFAVKVRVARVNRSTWHCMCEADGCCVIPTIRTSSTA